MSILIQRYHASLALAVTQPFSSQPCRYSVLSWAILLHGLEESLMGSKFGRNFLSPQATFERINDGTLNVARSPDKGKYNTSLDDR